MARGIVGAVVGQLDAVALREKTQRLTRRHFVIILNETEYVAAGGADKTIINLLPGRNIHGGAAVVMEGTQPQQLFSRRLERNVIADDFFNSRRVANHLKNMR